MPQDGPHEEMQDGASSSDRRASGSSPKSEPDWRDMFGVPEPVKKAFRKFPLTVYATNELPTTSPGRRDEHSLWIWTTEEGAVNGDFSFNPTCLKWQVSDTPFRFLVTCHVWSR